MRRLLVGLLTLTSTALLGTVVGLHPTPAAAALPGELVVNGTFAAGTAPWWNGPNTTMRVNAGVLEVTVAGGTANPWDAPTGQDDIVLTAGQAYTLSFDASASASASVRATVQLEQSPYTATLDRTIALTTSTQHFSFPFTSSLTTTLGQVGFQLGGRATGYTFRLDNVSLAPTPPGFYVDPDNNAFTWIAQNPNDSRVPSIRNEIANRPGARWFGNWNANIGAAVSSYVGAAQAAGKTPILVAYNIPGRDCGGPSSGGAGDATAYRAWISAFAVAIGSRPAIVVIEPDAVAQIDDVCMPKASDKQARYEMLGYATQQFRDLAPNAWAYLDAGNATWVPAATMAQRLLTAGVRDVRGFAVNVSNFYPTAQSESYGSQIVSALGYQAKFLVDTSRNGNGILDENHDGVNDDFCNPRGRKLGTPSAYGTGAAELLLWIKFPGDSDGPCGTSTAPAGTFDPGLADRLIRGV
ncbi:glycoside hydrolase family 6 protein [Micromonospora sp. NPDC049559]|uniref:glycoside hydrolase family 6 protein n=1 Tax=Micromonospora sp. NPDC049559 TaxID=3155923 RepID=UPI00342AB469